MTGAVILNLKEAFYSDKLHMEFVGKETCFFDQYDRGTIYGKGDHQTKNKILS